MHTAASITRNLAAMMAAQIVTFTLAFVLRVFIGRYLGDVGYGQLTTALSFTTILTLIVSFGTGSLLTKEVARDKGRAGLLFINAAVLRLLFGIVAYVVLIVVLLVIPIPEQEKGNSNSWYALKQLIYLIGLYMVLSAFTGLIGSIFQGYEKMFYLSVGMIAEKIVTTAVSACLLYTGHGIITIGWVYVLGGTVNLVISLVILLRTTRLHFNFSLRLALSLLRGGVPFYIWAVFGTIYERIDAIMLSFLTSIAVTGWYGVAFGLYETLGFLPAMLSTVLFPVLSRLFVSSPKSFQLTSQKALDLFTLITVPIALGTFLLAPKIIAILFPMESFANSIILLRILGLGQVLLFYNILFGMLLMAVDKQRQWSYTAIAGAIINPSLNLFLIPFFQNHFGNGGIGAALATEAVELMITLVAFHLLPPGLFTRSSLAVLLKVTLAGLAMAGVVWLANGWSILVQVAIGAAVYGGLCYALSAVRREEVAFVLSTLLKRQPVAEGGL